MVTIRENMVLEIMVKEEIAMAMGDITMTKTKTVTTSVDMATIIIVSHHGLISATVLHTTNQTIQPLPMDIIIINNHRAKAILPIHMVVNHIHQIIIKALRTIINNHNQIAGIQDIAIL